jgi:hypothetical protein
MKLSQFLTEEKKYGKAEYPEGYMPGIKVPKGGSMCANCEYWIKEGNMCKNKYWLTWHKGDANIPEAGNEYCCDWWHKA